MLVSYLRAAMRQATYEILPEDGSFYGQISDCPGVYANETTLEKCREVLEEVLEEWVLFRVHRNLDLPAFGDIGKGLLIRLLRQGKILREEWEQLSLMRILSMASDGKRGSCGEGNFMIPKPFRHKLTDEKTSGALCPPPVSASQRPRVADSTATASR